MQFSDAQVELGCRMKDAGLGWRPQVGHYVFDRGKVCKRGSPFQDGVYFILDYACFCRHVGGAEILEREMVWLHTWYDCRECENDPLGLGRRPPRGSLRR